MEFIVNEQGCLSLSQDMLTTVKNIAALISAFEDKDGMLRAALGADYDAIAKSVKIMSSELDAAYGELNTIIADMQEYMSRVHQVRVSLN